MNELKNKPFLNLLLDIQDSIDSGPKKTIPAQQSQELFKLLSWWSFTSFVARQHSFHLNIYSKNNHQAIQSLDEFSQLCEFWPVCWLDETESVTNADRDFVYISGSQGLSNNILSHFSCIYIKPLNLPDVLAVDHYWLTSCGALWFDEFRDVLDKMFSGQWLVELDALESTVRPANPSVTAVSSIFNGDAFLSGFLANSSSWDKYGQCEHFLVRAGSNGQEHVDLINYVDKFSNAVYINLSKDPGLYAVWNLGVQLSTAPYLTNANIDDRRAPDQVSSLIKFLDQHLDISVVSTKLRISHTDNMAWGEFDGCSAMFGNERSGSYRVDRLFLFEAENATSRNLPHCMPVWRRRLHNHAGLFDEDHYGPSADWEFWLRVGMYGFQYALLDEELGLYLQHENSYWHQNKSINFDQRIADKYAHFVRRQVLFSRVDLPLSRHVSAVLNACTDGDALAVLSGLVDCILRSYELESSKASQALINKIAQRSLGFANFYHIFGEHKGAFISMEDPVENALSLAIELLHSPALLSNAIGEELVKKALLDHYILTRSVLALVGLAFLQHKLGKDESEYNILKALIQLDPKGFWSAIARVYRFDVSLDELAEKFSAMSTCLSVTPRTSSKLKVWFYPVYSSNKYTRLLYENSVMQGAEVQGLTSLKQFAEIKAVSGCTNVVHIHWINELVGAENGLFPEEKSKLFLEQLERLKADGFKIRWTIHNRLSHHSKNEVKELKFREALYQCVDRVYLHHPMAISLVDWISDNGKKCSLIEHGNYLSLFKTRATRSDARQLLGFNKSDFIVLYIGVLQDYKGINEILPVIEKISERHPHFKFVVAGRIDSEKLKCSLDSIGCSNIIIHGAYLSDEEISLYCSAADMGFLSYRSILTSGTLFHLLSGGLPVIGPNLGTIPAYISKGWNGFIYEDSENLEEILGHCCKLPASVLEGMGSNALDVAASLTWKFH